MPFPFLPGGALLALAVLGGAIALFGLALKALDWSIDGIKGSMLPGVVLGLRDWERASHPHPTNRSPDGAESLAGIRSERLAPDESDTSEPEFVTLERVQPVEGRRARD